MESGLGLVLELGQGLELSSGLRLRLEWSSARAEIDAKARAGA